MEIAQARLARSARQPERPIEIATIIDGLWSIATPSDRLEHIHGKPNPAGVDLTFFFLPAPLSCVERATRICLTAIDRLPPFHGWLINPPAPPLPLPMAPSLN